MKILKNLLLTSFGLALFFYSCSSDSSGDSGENKELADQQNETENRTIPLSELLSGISIDGASTNMGTPPASTNNIDFQINTTTQEAFQSNGFRISFNSNDSFSGAYILLQDSDGNKADSYFEIPLSAITTNKGTSPKKKSRKHSKTQKSNLLTEDEFEIEVDFNNSIAPGQFCYEVCLYDDNNNISVIQTICVEIEAWGGNAEIVGEWVFDRFAEGGEDELEDINCDNGVTISLPYYKENEVLTLALNQDGSYYETLKGYDETLDSQATRSSCTATYSDRSDYDDKYSGNWAYNEDKETLTVIGFKYEDFLNPLNNEDYSDGLLYFDGDGVTAEVISGELVITDTYTELQNTYTDVYIFKRK